MTLSQAQHKIAKRYSFDSWKQVEQEFDAEHMEVLQYQVAEVYNQADKRESLRVCRAISVMIFLGMIIWACIWLIKVSNEPVPGERDYSGYGVYEERRFK